MATITGLDAFRTMAIEAKAIVSGSVRNGMLYLKRFDGQELPGVVVSGVPGPAGSINDAAAGGDLAGSRYPNPIIADGVITAAKLVLGTLTHLQVAAANRDGTASTPSMRTLGTGSQQAAPGNHTHTEIPRSMSGTVIHTATTPNEKTKIAYANVFPAGFFTVIPKVVLQIDTTVPEVIPYYSVCDRTLTGFSIVATRTTTTASNYHFIAMQQPA